jgi:hypothetical protein
MRASAPVRQPVSMNGAGGRASGEAAQMQRRLVAVAMRARAVDVRPFETAPQSEVLALLVPRTSEVLDDALGLATYLANDWSCASGRPVGAGDVDDTVEILRDLDRMTEEPPTSRTADVAFLANTHLRTRKRELQAVRPDTDAWALVAGCGSALRQVAKAAAAIEATLAAEHGLARELHFATELSQALEIRRRYAELARSIAAAHAHAAIDLRGALRGVGGAIAVLIGKSIYPHMRIADRIQLRSIQRRILGWLREPAADDREGRRVLTDLIGTADMLAHVSRRQELVEHDLLVGARVHAAILAGAGHASEIRALLAELRGRDAGIDALLDADVPPGDAWARALVAAGLVPAAREAVAS